MIKLKDLLKEKISVKSGKYLDVDGSMTSIPGPYERFKEISRLAKQK